MNLALRSLGCGYDLVVTAAFDDADAECYPRLIMSYLPWARGRRMPTLSARQLPVGLGSPSLSWRRTATGIVIRAARCRRGVTVDYDNGIFTRAEVELLVNDVVATLAWMPGRLHKRPMPPWPHQGPYDG